MKKIDLHTHSSDSPDGGLRRMHYEKMLAAGGLDFIAVTDHNTITHALQLQQAFGSKIIIGEEISTIEGDIIGLYLSECIPAGLSVLEAVTRIHAQGGLVYVPHPFERIRKGVGLRMLQLIARDVDIIEVYNGRAMGSRGNSLAQEWTNVHEVSGAASSDAHGWFGWGKTYTRIAQSPTRDTLVELLRHGSYVAGSPGVLGVLYPKANRMRKRLQATSRKRRREE